MAEVIRMPRMSDTMEEGVIVGWMKKVGDKVEPGTVLAEVETDKAVMELESFYEGVLLHIGVEKGPVPVNGILAVIGKEGEDYKAALAGAKDETASSPAPKEEKKAEAVESNVEKETASSTEIKTVQVTPVVETVQPPTTTDNEAKRVKASPLAKNMAEKAGIHIEDVTGTGDNGRIVRKDIEQAMATSGTAQVSKTAVPPVTQQFVTGKDIDTPLSQMRKIIAKRLSESMFTAPHFYLTMEINMGRAMEARKMINDTVASKISFNDFVVKAASMALRSHPVINSSWLGDKIRQNGNINIGIAVAVDEGLLVPIVRNADYLTLSQISESVKSLAAKAKERKLQPDEMQGNTFTISNLGMFDIESFTAIINPPDACIMAVGSIVQKPIVKNDQIVVGNTMKVMLSCDHRVVDGASGAKFLQTFKMYLEEPVRMLA
ncbi:MAG TPA: pyruvate dehydrogenase complex dihydrolipoamide acetyltransferase [Saprospiraceae bacterium]|nr:pyruvate dehydrogenase complex dihydrolipoamide acetyltransferase [Saprospiraceae bacterium]